MPRKPPATRCRSPPASSAHAATWEGKEVRFGIPASATFNVSATGTSTGAVDSFTDSYMPLGGADPDVPDAAG